MNLPKETFLKLILNFLMSLDRLFILGGKQLKILIPVLYTPFCSVAKDVGFVEGDAVLLGDGS
jgi:hypothetical protein